MARSSTKLPGQANKLTISGEDDSLTVTDTGTDDDHAGGCATVDAQTVTCPAADILRSRSTSRTSMTPSRSRRLSRCRQHGNDTLNGGDGPDPLKGGDGDDILNGNAGNDVLSASRRRPDGRRRWRRHGQLREHQRCHGRSERHRQQDTGAGMDTFSGIENVNGSTTVTTYWSATRRPTRSSAAAGRHFYVDGGGSDAVTCGDGSTRSSGPLRHRALSL